MNERGSWLRDLWLVPLAVIVLVPFSIFALVMLIFDHSPPFKHGPYNGHEYPEDL